MRRARDREAVRRQRGGRRAVLRLLLLLLRRVARRRLAAARAGVAARVGVPGARARRCRTVVMVGTGGSLSLRVRCRDAIPSVLRGVADRNVTWCSVM